MSLPPHTPTAIISLQDISNGSVNQALKDLATVASGFNVILWMGLVFFPFIQVMIYRIAGIFRGYKVLWNDRYKGFRGIAAFLQLACM